MCRRITEHQALNLPGIAGEVIHKMPPAPSACHTLQTSVKFKYDSLLSDYQSTLALLHFLAAQLGAKGWAEGRAPNRSSQE